MQASTPLRALLIFLTAGTSIWLTYEIAREAWGIAHKSDEQIIRGFTGAAPEDIFGFGFWPTWLLLAAAQALAIAVIWLIGERRSLRHLALALGLLFGIVSFFDYSSFQRTETLWNARTGR